MEFLPTLGGKEVPTSYEEISQCAKRVFLSGFLAKAIY